MSQPAIKAFSSTIKLKVNLFTHQFLSRRGKGLGDAGGTLAKALFDANVAEIGSCWDSICMCSALRTAHPEWINQTSGLQDDGRAAE